MSDYENDDVQKVMRRQLLHQEVIMRQHSLIILIISQRAFDKADHWVKNGVKPNQIFLDDRSMGVINFRKEMRDPLLIQAGVERLIDFRCSLTLSDTDVDAVFSSVCYYEPGAEPTYINAYDPELSSIKEVLNMVSNNLFSYLQKPLLQQDFD